MNTVFWSKLLKEAANPFYLCSSVVKNEFQNTFLEKPDA